MAEENQAQQEPKEPQQVKQEPKEQQRVTNKDPKKVEAGKRLAAINCKKREEQAQLEKTASVMNQYHGFDTILVLGVIGGLGYNVYRSKKGPTIREVMVPVSQRPCPQVIATQPPSGAQPAQTNKFDMD